MTLPAELLATPVPEKVANINIHNILIIID
jgi:hypothetical protein